MRHLEYEEFLKKWDMREVREDFEIPIELINDFPRCIQMIKECKEISEKMSGKEQYE